MSPPPAAPPDREEDFDATGLFRASPGQLTPVFPAPITPSVITPHSKETLVFGVLNPSLSPAPSSAANIPEPLEIDPGDATGLFSLAAKPSSGCAAAINADSEPRAVPASEYLCDADQPTRMFETKLPPAAPAPTRKEVPALIILVLVLLFLTALAWSLFFGWKR